MPKAKTGKQITKSKFPKARVTKRTILNYTLWEIKMGNSVIGESIISCGDAWKVAGERLSRC